MDSLKRLGNDLSVVICTHNRAEDVGDCLAALVPQLDKSSTEVRVIDSGSRDDQRRTLERLVASVSHVELLRIDEPGVSLARNKGIGETKSEWVAFLDDDAIPSADWLENAHRLMSLVPEKCAIIAGAVLPQFPKGASRLLGKRWSQMLSVVQRRGEGDCTASCSMVAANVLFRRSALVDGGGFSSALGRHGTTLLSGGEKLLQEQLIERGWSAWYSDRLKVRHKISAERLTQEWILRRAYWDGLSDQRINTLNARKPNVLEAGEVLAKTLALLLLYFADTPRSEFRIRFWYNVGWLRERVVPGVRGIDCRPPRPSRAEETTVSGAIDCLDSRSREADIIG
jgi:glucosyl-dolichyl phosphate glucuronosyltransferase